MSEKSIVLLSGGIDSAICMATARMDTDEVYSVYCDYGQNNSDFVRDMARDQHKYWDCDVENWYQLDLTESLGEICNRADGFGIVGDEYTEDESGMRDDGRGSHYVPMRNLTLLTHAGALADTVGAEKIYFGAQSWTGESIPDTQPPFLDAAESALTRSLAEDASISIETPIGSQTKAQAVKWGDTLGVPWHYTWSCFEEPDDWENPVPCGECSSCEERAAAFRMAGVEAPFGTTTLVPETEQEKEAE